jgi:hypothetical protein
MTRKSKQEQEKINLKLEIVELTSKIEELSKLKMKLLSELTKVD